MVITEHNKLMKMSVYFTYTGQICEREKVLERNWYVRKIEISKQANVYASVCYSQNDARAVASYLCMFVCSRSILF